MKKILIMIDSLTCGGAEKSLISLMPFLCCRDYDITLSLRQRGGLFEKYIPDGVKVETFSANTSWLASLLYSLSLRIPILRKKHSAELYWSIIGNSMPLNDIEYDVAIAYQQGFPTFYIANKVRAEKKICWVNVDLKSAGYSPSFCKKFYSQYDHVAAVSDILRDSIVFPAYVPDKNKIFTCWDILNEKLIRKMAGERNIRTQDDNRIHITTVGRLVPIKGYDLAIKAAKILKNSGIDFVWHFVGGGRMFNDLRKQIVSEGLGENIILEGEQLNPYIFMAAADVYVQTSLFEGFGLTIGEAKILGKPIVSTNFQVVFNQIEDGVNGLVVEKTPIAIANGITRLLENSTLRNNIINAVKSEHNTTADTESAKIINLIDAE